jgi:hypothetical protein
MNENPSAVPLVEPAKPPPDIQPPSWLATLTRLWLLLPIGAASRALPARQSVIATVIMSVTWLALWAALDRWEIQPDPQFFAAGIPLLAWYALAIVALAGLLRWRSRAARGFAALLVLALGVVPAPLLLFTVGADYLAASWFPAAMALTGIYALLYLMRGLRAVTGEPQRMAAVTGGVFIAVFIWTTDKLNVIPDVWAQADAEATAPADAADDAEEILFSQSARIDEALAAMDSVSAASARASTTSPTPALTPAVTPKPTPPSAPNPRAYFLGFAGVGDEKVFTQEIGLASRVLGERYAMDTRTLSLINDQRDLRRAPLATVSGLKYALQGLGARMNLDNDILFLSISSHGAPDPAIAVSNAQLPLNDLTDEDLSEALRDSGIRWRVIIISACYAGAFIDSLRDPQTIVITAAAADRTSFGCSTDSDLTYFGEAFYRDALPAAGTLRQAFEQAKVAIAARERAEHVTPSNPQAYFGAKIEAKLAAMNPAPD